MSPSDPKQRTDITLLKLVIKKLEEDDSKCSKSLVAPDRKQPTPTYQVDAPKSLTFDRLIKDLHAIDRRVEVFLTEACASFKHELNSAQAEIAELESYAPQAQARYGDDLEQWNSSRANLGKKLAEMKRKLEEFTKADHARVSLEIIEAFETIFARYASPQEERKT